MHMSVSHIRKKTKCLGTETLTDVYKGSAVSVNYPLFTLCSMTPVITHYSCTVCDVCDLWPRPFLKLVKISSRDAWDGFVNSLHSNYFCLYPPAKYYF